jgi:hypothetical protein
MKDEKQVGYLWDLSLPLKAINESGIRLRTDMWAIYFVIRAAIDSTWSHKERDDERQYAWVSSQYIKSQLRSLPDVADITDNGLYRKLKQLEEVGLLIRMQDNDKKGRCYLAKGPADDLLTYSQPSEKMQGDPLQNFNGGIEKMQGDNSIDYNKIKDNNIPPTPLDNGSTSEPPKPAPRVKKKLTRAETQDFYNKQMDLFDGFKIPKELEGGAAARGIKATHITGAYVELIDYMTKPSDKWPDGMWGCVLTKTHQLSLDQFCKLVLKLGMKRDAIKAYLDTWENKKYDNGSIYATFCDWWSREKTVQQHSDKVKVMARQGEFNK